MRGYDGIVKPVHKRICFEGGDIVRPPRENGAVLAAPIEKVEKCGGKISRVVQLLLGDIRV